jgi:hypothetical protein
VVGWGRNDQGQATPPEGLQGVIAIDCGGYHSLALLNNGTVVGWGKNDHGQITPPEGLGGVTAIAAGESHSLALLNNGTVVGWGNNDHGQITPPEGLGGVTAIAAGESHSLALLNNGTVVGWGSNSEGQAQPPAGRQGVTAIAAGGYHSLALLNNGTVVGWGNNDYGQAMPPETGSIPEPDLPPVLEPATTPGPPPAISRPSPQPNLNITAISAGKFSSIALQQDGNFTSWGYDITKMARLQDVPGLTAFGSRSNPTTPISYSGRIVKPSSDREPLELILARDESVTHEYYVRTRQHSDKLLQIANHKLQGADTSASAKEWLEAFPNRPKFGAIYEEKFWKNLPANFLEQIEKIEDLFKDERYLTSGSSGDKEEKHLAIEFMEAYRKHKEEMRELAEEVPEEKKVAEGKVMGFLTRLDAERNKTELSKRQAKKMGAVAFILVNQAMWNFDGISPDEYQLILDMTKDWDRRLGMKLSKADHINLVQWAINKWNEDAQNQNHDNYQAIVGNLCLFNRFERAIVPAQMHKVGDLDGGITAEQLQFIHDIETYLNTEGLVAEEDETRMNTDQAVCYILLVLALWDDDGFTQEEQGAVAEIMGNFSVGLPVETLTVMLEENVEHYQRDDANKDIKHLENCMEQATSQLSDIWKQWLIESLQYLAEVGGTTDQQQTGFIELLPKELGLEKEPEKVAA